MVISIVMLLAISMLALVAMSQTANADISTFDADDVYGVAYDNATGNVWFNATDGIHIRYPNKTTSGVIASGIGGDIASVNSNLVYAVDKPNGRIVGVYSNGTTFTVLNCGSGLAVDHIAYSKSKGYLYYAGVQNISLYMMYPNKTTRRVCVMPCWIEGLSYSEKTGRVYLGTTSWGVAYAYDNGTNGDFAKLNGGGVAAGVAYCDAIDATFVSVEGAIDYLSILYGNNTRVDLTTTQSLEPYQVTCAPDKIEVYQASHASDKIVRYPAYAIIPPTAGFTVSPESGAAPLTVTVTSTATYANTYQYSWGDGSNNSTDASPTHTYVAVSTYTIIQTVTNTDGSAVVTHQVTSTTTTYTYDDLFSGEYVPVGTTIGMTNQTDYWQNLWDTITGRNGTGVTIRQNMSYFRLDNVSTAALKPGTDTWGTMFFVLMLGAIPVGAYLMGSEAGALILTFLFLFVVATSLPTYMGVFIGAIVVMVITGAILRKLGVI